MKTPIDLQKITLSALLLFASFFSFAQQWSEYTSVDGVKIYQADMECRDANIPPQLADQLPGHNYHR